MDLLSLSQTYNRSAVSVQEREFERKKKIVFSIISHLPSLLMTIPLGKLKVASFGSPSALPETPGTPATSSYWLVDRAWSETRPMTLSNWSVK
jgi:hypothetical protein